jgi:hypothetical protein
MMRDPDRTFNAALHRATEQAIEESLAEIGDRFTLAFCGHSAEPCDHDWSGWRDFDGGGEAYCVRCGLGALADTLSRE